MIRARETGSITMVTFSDDNGIIKQAWGICSYNQFRMMRKYHTKPETYKLKLHPNTLNERH